MISGGQFLPLRFAFYSYFQTTSIKTTAFYPKQTSFRFAAKKKQEDIHYRGYFLKDAEEIYLNERSFIDYHSFELVNLFSRNS